MADSSTDILLPNTMPQCEYMYGCVATSVAMLLAYYDLYGYCSYDISNLIDGTPSVFSRGSDGSSYNMNEFDSVLGKFTASEEYVSRFYETSAADELPYTFVDGDAAKGLNTGAWNCLADWLGTGQYWRGSGDLGTCYYYGSIDDISTYSDSRVGSMTIPAEYCDFKYGLALYTESVGYTLDTQNTATYSVSDFSFADFKTEIDAGRVVLVSMSSTSGGHMVVAYGYNDATGEIIFDDTYTADCRMAWDGTYLYSDSTFSISGVTTVVFDTSTLTALDPELEGYFGDWLTDGSDALALAVAYDTPILIGYFLDECGPCENLKNDVFSSDAFQAYADSASVVLLRSAEIPGVSGCVPTDYPTCYVVSSAGVVLAEKTGFSTADDWMSWFETYVDLKTSDATCNLTYAAPDGWSSALIVAITENATESAAAISEIDLVKIRFGVANDGTEATAETQASIYVDGVFYRRTAIPALTADGSVTTLEMEIGRLTVGEHTIRVMLDSGDSVTESKEGDNTQSLTVYIQQADPDKTYLSTLESVTDSTVDSGWVILRGGTLDLKHGAVSNEVEILDGGLMYVSSGAAANETDVKSGGNVHVYSGGTVSGTEIFDGGTMYVSSGGSALDTLAGDGTEMNVLPGGYAENTVQTGDNRLFVYNSALVSGGTVGSESYLGLYGTASAVNITSAGNMFVAATGTAYDTVLTGGSDWRDNGAMTIGSQGARAIRTSVGSGGILLVSSGAIAQDTTLSAGGSMYVSASGKLTGKLIMAGGSATLNGAASLGTLDNLRYELTPQSGPILSFSYGSPTSLPTITVNADNAWGEYILIQGDLSSLSAVDVILQSGGTDAATLTSGATVDVGGKSFTLTLASKTLTLTVTGTDTQAPDMPRNAQGSLSKNLLSIEWDAVSDFSGVSYELRYSASPTQENAVTVALDTNSAALYLASGVWYWQLRTVDGAGNVSDWTESTSVSVTYAETVSGGQTASRSFNSDVIFGDDMVWSVSGAGSGAAVNFSVSGLKLTVAGAGTVVESVRSSFGSYGISGEDLTLDLTASEADDLLIRATTAESFTPSNYPYIIGIDDSGELTLDGGFAGRVESYASIENSSTINIAYLFGIRSQGLTVNGDLSGSVFALATLDSGEDTRAYGIYTGSSGTLSVSGRISGLIAAAADTAYGIYTGSFCGTITGTVFAGGAGNTLAELEEKLLDFESNQSGLVALSDGHYAIFSYGASDFTLAADALVIGDIWLNAANSAFTVSGAASHYGEIKSGYTHTVTLALNSDSLSSARLYNEGWNTRTSLCVDTLGLTEDGTYILVQGAGAKSISKLTLCTSAGDLSLSTGSDVTSGGATYALAYDSGAGTLALTVSAISCAISAPSVTPDTADPTNGDVTLSVRFDPSAVEYQYCVDDGKWIAYDGTAITVTENGIYRFRSIDANGAISPSAGYTVSNIDRIPPAAPAVSVGGNTTEWTNTGVEISIAADPDRATLWLALGEDGIFTVCENNFTATENGTYRFYAQDAAGNRSDTVSVVIANIDSAAPDAPDDPTVSLAAGKITIFWDAVADNDGGSGVTGYDFQFGTETGHLAGTEKTYAALADGTYTFQVRAADLAGNTSVWTVKTFTVDFLTSGMTGDSGGVAWTALDSITEYRVQLVSASGEKVFQTSSSALEFINLSAGDYQWNVASQDGSVRSEEQTFSASGRTDAPALLEGLSDGADEYFFASASGIWRSGAYAKNTATGELVSIRGKNCFTDLFAGSDDYSTIFLTDDANGDALFLDDLFSDFPDAAAARLSGIDEIFAGAGDDVIDFTSTRFTFDSGDSLTLHGGAGNDTLWGADGVSNVLFGDAGNDALSGGNGDDILIGGAGRDLLSGGGGNDIFAYGANDWGCDTIRQDTGGTVTIWFADGVDETSLVISENASGTVISGKNGRIAVAGLTASEITLKFGADSSESYNRLAAAGVF